MYPNLEFKNNEFYILRCPKCNNALGINPLIIKQCEKCGTKIEHTQKYVQDWLLYCDYIMKGNKNYD